jgi:outer membrane lipoprotein SlyB
MSNFLLKSLGAFTIISVTVILQSGCQTARPNTAVGGLFGTAAGSVLGAAIGSHEGKSGQGALIGGLAGGGLGALLGNQADQANDRDQRNFNAAQQQAQADAISMNQIVQMTRSGLSDELIANQIQRNGVLALPTTNDLILLKQNGVSDRVIQALQSARPAGQLPLASQTRAVLVQPDLIYAEPICPGPPLFYEPAPWHFNYCHGPVRHHRSHSHAGFSIGF